MKVTILASAVVPPVLMRDLPAFPSLLLTQWDVFTAVPRCFCGSVSCHCVIMFIFVVKWVHVMWQLSSEVLGLSNIVDATENLYPLIDPVWKPLQIKSWTLPHPLLFLTQQSVFRKKKLKKMFKLLINSLSCAFLSVSLIQFIFLSDAIVCPGLLRGELFSNESEFPARARDCERMRE